MTEKEAIRRIQEHRAIHFNQEYPHTFLITQALDMAIAALEKQAKNKCIKDYGFGKDHNPKSVELYNFISELDFENGDYFCFKSGGDGDNGEFLMDLLDCYFANK